MLSCLEIDALIGFELTPRCRPYEKPWTKTTIPRRSWEKIIFWGGILIGLIIGCLIVWLAYRSVVNHEVLRHCTWPSIRSVRGDSGLTYPQYCLVLDDDFKTIDTNTWNYEIQRGGFGTGSFEWTTKDPKNVYTDKDGLHIVPTLTSESTDITIDQIYNGHTVNMTTDGTCTTDKVDMCSIASNKTLGTIINPVRSARLNTKDKKTIKYGKVEVVARMPQGDWIWPAIWMMPQQSVYGDWPRSGEMDIAESKGNHGDRYPDGRDSVSSTLHWGPVMAEDAFWRTSGKHNLRRTDYSKAFHTYGLEWSENYLFFYIDSRLRQVFFLNFQRGYRGMYDRGQFAKKSFNNSALPDPWSQTGRANTPFDQDFFLILNVAVGGTNGYFPDSTGKKPWVDRSETAPKQFFDGRADWMPTWGAGDLRGMAVKSVKMWSEGKCR